MFVSILLQAHSSLAFITRAVRGTHCGVTDFFHISSFRSIVSNHGETIYKIKSTLSIIRQLRDMSDNRYKVEYTRLR